jgi:hypothetical protein
LVSFKQGFSLGIDDVRFDNVITGGNFIFDERSSIRSRDHLSFDVIDALARRADVPELDSLGTNAEEKSFSSSGMKRGRHAAGAYSEAAAHIDIDEFFAEGDDFA